MTKTLETTGRNEDDAINAALRELGLSRDDVSVTVLERAKSGFFGIGASPARVRVTYEVPDEEPQPAPAAPAKSPEKPAKAAGRPSAPPSAPPVKPSAPAPKPSEAPGKAPEAAPEKPPVVKTSAEIDADVERVRVFLAGLFERMGVEAQIDASFDTENNAVSVELSGAKVGALIGRRGETLDAIQHLANYVLNNGSDEHTRVNVDAENYRAKRADTLTALAKKTAAKVVRYHRNQTLEPMNAYERHVIHTALQDYPGVTTYSTGTEPGRRVVVAYEASTAPKESFSDRNDRNDRGDRRYDRRDNRDSRPRRSGNGGYSSRANFGSAAPAPEKPPVDKTVREWN